MSVAWSAYRTIAPALGAMAPLARVFAPESERILWRERLGHVQAPGPVDAWIHAASLGEAQAVGPLLRELTTAKPGASFHLTATTRTGRARLGQLGISCSLAPLDAPQTVGRFLAARQPSRLFLIETELWPHWLLAARAAGVRVAAVSARLSSKSVSHYRRLGTRFLALIEGLDAVLCQSVGDEARWRSLGSRAVRTAVVGNLKDDGLLGPADDRAAARLGLGLDPARPLLVLGSVRPDEVALLARAWKAVPSALRARWQVVAAPRHPGAARGLRREAAASGQTLVAEGAPAGGAWRWDERLGVLGDYYAAADVAIVGGSFGRYGGHNPLEPAARGAAVIVGPHYWAQADGLETLAAAGGARVADDETALAGALTSWLADEVARTRAGVAALAVVQARRGAAKRAVDCLVGWGLWPPP